MKKAVATTALVVFVGDAFSSPKTAGGRRIYRSIDDSLRRHRGTLSLPLSTREEALAVNIKTDENLDFDALSPNGFLASMPKLYKGAALLATPILLVVILSLSGSSFTMIASTYSELLNEYPLPVKSLTSGVLCGVSDTIAQLRDPRRRDFNVSRLVRFAGKGCLGGLIWTFWYDSLDGFLSIDNEVKMASSLGFESSSAEWIRQHTAVVTTGLSILIEQFVWCPLVFGLFEIPVSTALNGGGSTSLIKQEIDDKLGGLLVDNAKVWTLANVIIYNAPVQYRTPISNIVDILWQSIVSDVAADCGSVENDVCDVPSEKDLSFYAEKSRI